MSGTDDISTSIRVADLSEGDRPREKALTRGIGALDNAELLAIILGGGLPGLSVVDMSRHILLQCDNRLDTLAAMPPREMMQRFKGVGQAKAVTLSALFELARRHRSEVERAARREVTTVRSSADAAAYALHCLPSHLDTLQHEEFWVLMLTRANRITAAELISRGGTAATVVDAKLLARSVLHHLAASVILVHNHPSGQLSPSSQDDALTRRLKDALALLDIRVLDHIIVAAGGGYYSYADNTRL